MSNEVSTTWSLNRVTSYWCNLTSAKPAKNPQTRYRQNGYLPWEIDCQHTQENMECPINAQE